MMRLFGAKRRIGADDLRRRREAKAAREWLSAQNCYTWPQRPEVKRDRRATA